jgi:DNA polymerase III epsilon subunit-like protein
MTKIVCFDTETTGLIPKGISPTVKNVDEFPHIVQFSFVVYDTITQHTIEECDIITTLPHNIIIPTVCSNVHGITRAISDENGQPLLPTLLKFFAYVHDPDALIIAHNLSFDLKMVQAESIRLINKYEMNSKVSKRTREKTKQNQLLIDTLLILSTLPISSTIYEYPTKLYCTMMANINFCNIVRYNSRGPYQKYPTLTELYQKLFKKMPENMHNSLYDVYATLKCFLKKNCNTSNPSRRNPILLKPS